MAEKEEEDDGRRGGWEGQTELEEKIEYLNP